MKIKMTENIELKNQILEELKQNSGYCPCRLEKTSDTKCICKEFKEQEHGTCYCGLYYKEP